MIRRRWPYWIALILVVAAGVGVIAFPTFYIMPFKPQAAGTMQWALAARTMAPALTVAALAISLVLLVVVLRRSRRWWSRGLAVLTVAPLALGVWFARQNHFEWMFNPIDAPAFVSSEKASFVAPGDVVMAIRIGNDAVAYPIRQIAYHHVVNDIVAGEPVVATY
jgi:Protein of unknown function (DUF3179)